MSRAVRAWLPGRGQTEKHGSTEVLDLGGRWNAEDCALDLACEAWRTTRTTGDCDLSLIRVNVRTDDGALHEIDVAIEVVPKATVIRKKITQAPR